MNLAVIETAIQSRREVQEILRAACSTDDQIPWARVLTSKGCAEVGMEPADDDAATIAATDELVVLARGR
jgi:hypothetical protein